GSAGAGGARPQPPSAQEDDADWYAASMAGTNPLDRPRKVKSWNNEIGAWFRRRAEQRGFTPPQALALWKEVFAFASFGFCKSHAAAFALPTFVSSWMKAHHPAEFFAGILTHDPGMYPRRLIVADARRFGIPILPIDVNRSDAVYRAEPVGEAMGVRLALSEVRDISEAEMDSITAASRKRRFSSLEDLWRRTEVSRPVLENLIHVGALDRIELRSRRELLWRAVDLAERPALARGRAVRRHATPAAPEQLSLSLDEPISQELSELPSYTPLEETEAELEVSGMDARRHLMALYEPLVAEIGCVQARHLGRQRNDSAVWVAGVKVASQTPAIRSGRRIIFVTLDDLTGPIDVTVFERAQPRGAHTVFHSWLLLVGGVVRKRGGASHVHRTDPDNVGVTVVVDEVFDLAELAADRDAGNSLAAALGRQRRKQSARAAVTRPPPDPSSPAPPERGLKPPARMWHASGGSAGG
ncbi:MAG: OB-fold nucleic acid binding domain-containing protein, partial [Actinomycetota bacterium]